MIYPEEDIVNVLNCPRCKIKYNGPKVIIPCSNTLCNTCITELCDDTSIECFFCRDKHPIPEGGFKADKNIERLLNVKPKEIHINNQYTRELKDKLTHLALVFESYSQKIKDFEQEIDKYCDSLNNQIDIITEKKIERLNQIRENYLKVVNEYRNSYKINFDNNKEHINNNIKETQTFLEKWTKYLKGFEIDDEILKEQTLEAQWELERLRLAEENFEFLKFNAEKMNFEANENDEEITDELIGKFTKTKIEKLEYLNELNYTVISASGDKTLKIWDLKKCECIKTLNGHGSFVSSFVVVDKNTIVSGSSDKTLKIWKLNSGNCVETLQGHTDVVYCLCLLNSNTVISGSFDKTIKIWSLENMQCVKTLEAPDQIWCLCLINRNRLVSGGKDKNLIVWNLDNSKPVQTMKGHTDGIYCVSTLDDIRIVTGSWDKTVKIWNFITGTCLETLVEHTGDVFCILKFDMNTVISGSKDKNIKIWKLDENGRGTCTKTLLGHTDAIRFLCRVGRTKILSGSWDNSIKVWSLENEACIGTLNGHSGAIPILSILLN